MRFPPTDSPLLSFFFFSVMFYFAATCRHFLPLFTSFSRQAPMNHSFCFSLHHSDFLPLRFLTFSDISFGQTARISATKCTHPLFYPLSHTSINNRPASQKSLLFFFHSLVFPPSKFAISPVSRYEALKETNKDKMIAKNKQLLNSIKNSKMLQIKLIKIGPL